MPASFDPANDAAFDRHADTYEAQHRASIAASGEDPAYFAAYKRAVLERILSPRLGGRPVLDFGCGVGGLLAELTRSFDRVHGYDPSPRSAALARERVPAAVVHDQLEAVPVGIYGAVVIANVLHHVAPGRRPSLLHDAAARLDQGGTLVVFEHNPLNPLTRRAVAACPFDEGVELLWPWQATRLLEAAGLSDVQRDFIVFFPRALAILRSIEPRLAWMPLGAQVCVWGDRR
jgi:SAM-dependent methyltransferase